MTRGVALFDLDRTLVREDTPSLFIRYEYEKGMTSRGRIALVGWWRLLYTFGLVDSAGIARRVLGWYEGRDEIELRAFTEVWFHERVMPFVSEEGRRVVEEHRARGDELLIVTASTRYVAEQVGRTLGIERIVCTELRVERGVLTGELEGPVCYGMGKLARVRDALGDEAALASATAYTDSITDLPLLEAVRHPNAVNPDPRLARLARRRSWPVLSW